PQPGPEPVPPNHLLAVPQPTAGERQPSLEAVERDYILTVLRQTNGVITGPRGAAQLLDLPPSTLRNRMKKLGITSVSQRSWSLAPPVATSAPQAATALQAAPSPLQDGSRS